MTDLHPELRAALEAVVAGYPVGALQHNVLDALLAVEVEVNGRDCSVVGCTVPEHYGKRTLRLGEVIS